jgi:RNA polymerase sigma-70 factor (ECF subfamily)
LDDEAELIEQARTGSGEAITQLVMMHQGRVRAYIGRYVRNHTVVDDIAQDVFLVAINNLNSYLGEASFDKWLLGIARNRALAHLRDDSRRRKRESGRLEAVTAPWLEKELAGQSDCSRAEREISALQDCVKNLPENSAQLISEHYFKGRSSVELAKILGKNEGTLRMTLLRIRQALRDCIQNRLATSGGI